MTTSTNNPFVKPRLISDEMCKFMKIPLYSRRSITEVTAYVSGYIRQNGCFDPRFKRRIIPDSKLRKLLGVNDREDVSYFNLQRFLKRHYTCTSDTVRMCGVNPDIGSVRSQ